MSPKRLALKRASPKKKNSCLEPVEAAAPAASPRKPSPKKKSPSKPSPKNVSPSKPSSKNVSPSKPSSKNVSPRARSASRKTTPKKNLALDFDATLVVDTPPSVYAQNNPTPSNIPPGQKMASPAPPSVSSSDKNTVPSTNRGLKREKGQSPAKPSKRVARTEAPDPDSQP